MKSGDKIGIVASGRKVSVNNIEAFTQNFRILGNGSNYESKSSQQ